MKSNNRKSKMFWVVEDSGVRRLLCYECCPSNEYWWCPEAGFSGSTIHHFFTTQKKALEKAIPNLTAEKKETSDLLAKLRKQYRSL